MLKIAIVVQGRFHGFDLARELSQPVRISELIEEQLCPLLMRCLRALINRGARVGLQIRRELIDRLETHGLKVASSDGEVRSSG